MSNRFYDNEFEKFLRNQTDQHRMYPSDKVWRGIQHEIHGYKKWPALTFVSIFIIAALVITTVILKPHTELAPVSAGKNISNGAATGKNTVEVPAALPSGESGYSAHLSVGNITQQTIADVIETVNSGNVEETIVMRPVKKPVNTTISADAMSDNSVKATGPPSDVNQRQTASATKVSRSRQIFSTSMLLRDDLKFRDYSGDPYDNNYRFSFASSVNSYGYDRDFNEKFSFNLNRSGNNSPIIKLNGSSKVDFQFYVTPSVSYRRLVDDVHGSLAKSYISAMPYNANYFIDVNRVIQHKSAIGYEVGFSLGYNVNRKFALRSGFQFNVRQYNIDAYVHSTEPASISLMTNGTNDVWNTISGFRNVAGSSPIVLKNRYYEISMPVGIDWRPVNRKFAWGVAASIQPTYTFDKEPFIISSNYKNYADGSQLMRNWNINTSVETYLGYNTGNYRWQIGPQIRYQLLPTMNNSYPIREYLIDYGIKIGLIRTLK